jgi:hypothetical protein
MGIYVSNRVFSEAHDYAAEIPANEAYDAAFGCAHILVDRVDNDRALFESTIRSDIAEVMAVREGYEVLNEGAFGDIVKKIVEMFKKLLAKIKGIFNAFLAKLAGAFKNGKDLVKKYEKQIYKYSGTWKKFKVSGIRKPKTEHENIREAIDSVFAAKSFSGAARYSIKKVAISDEITEADYNSGLTGFITVKQINDGEIDDLKLRLLEMYVTGPKISDYKDIDTEVKDYLYDDEDKIDGDDDKVSASYFSKSWIKPVLQDDKWENNVRKTNEKLEKAINNIIDALIKTNDNLSKFRSEHEKDDDYKYANLDDRNFSNVDNVGGGRFGKDTSVSKSNNTDVKADDITPSDKKDATNVNEKYQKIIHAMQKIASNEQTVISDTTSKYMENVKFAMAQARKMWTAAAAYTATTHNESYEYVQAVAECAEEQFYANMESLG